MRFPSFAAAAVTALLSYPAAAATISWADWQSSGPGTAAGQIVAGADTIGVTYSGTYSFAQTAGGINYWSPSAPYISAAVANAPPAADIIAFAAGSPPAKMITFSQAVVDPVIALVSWNGNVVDFGTPIEILSYGAGYWGNGTPVLNATGTGFTGVGEVHGVIRLPGTFTQISFTDISENWHGLTVGITAVSKPPTGVPEPATLTLLGFGLLGLAGARRALRT